MNHEKASYTCQTDVSAVEVATDCCDTFFLLYCKVSHFFLPTCSLSYNGNLSFPPL